MIYDSLKFRALSPSCGVGLLAPIRSQARSFTLEFEVLLKWSMCALVSPHWEDFVTAVLFFFTLRASRVLAAQLSLKKTTVVNALSSLLIQTDTTGRWNRTDVSPLYGKALWEQLCMSNFACYEILIPLFSVILNNSLSHTLTRPVRNKI